jgi:hypothetical protein
VTVQRGEIEQARANMVKRMRARVRLEKSIEADNILNDVLPKAEKVFNAAVQRGELPSADEVMAALGE